MKNKTLDTELHGEAAETAVSVTRTSRSLFGVLTLVVLLCVQCAPRGDPFPRLRDAAKTRKITWQIYRSNFSDFFGSYNFVIDAAPEGCPGPCRYVEQGGQPYWFEDGFGSPEAAAWWLLDNMDSPNRQPRPEPGRTAAKS